MAGGLDNFVVSENNPNDTAGGSGCLCSPDKKATGCEGPFVVFKAVTTDNGYSPHAVACEACIQAAARKLERVESGEEDALRLGN